MKFLSLIPIAVAVPVAKPFLQVGPIGIGLPSIGFGWGGWGW